MSGVKRLNYIILAIFGACGFTISLYAGEKMSKHPEVKDDLFMKIVARLIPMMIFVSGMILLSGLIE